MYMDRNYIMGVDSLGFGEGIMFDRARRQESDVGFETIRAEYYEYTRDENSSRNSV